MGHQVQLRTHSGAQQSCLERTDVKALLKSAPCMHLAGGAPPSTWAQLVAAFEQIESAHRAQRRDARAAHRRGGGGESERAAVAAGQARPPARLAPIQYSGLMTDVQQAAESA